MRVTTRKLFSVIILFMSLYILVSYIKNKTDKEIDYKNIKLGDIYFDFAKYRNKIEIKRYYTDEYMLNKKYQFPEDKTTYWLTYKNSNDTCPFNNEYVFLETSGDVPRSRDDFVIPKNVAGHSDVEYMAINFISSDFENKHGKNFKSNPEAFNKITDLHREILSSKNSTNLINIDEYTDKSSNAFLVARNQRIISIIFLEIKAGKDKNFRRGIAKAIYQNPEFDFFSEILFSGQESAESESKIREMAINCALNISDEINLLLSHARRDWQNKDQSISIDGN